MTAPRIPWAGWWPYAGRCSCGASVDAASFRDALSWKDHHVTFLCQACQDRLYFAASSRDPSVRFPIRRGVVAAACDRECGLELAMLPFLCVVPEGTVAWEARYLLRAGFRLAPLDLWVELAPMHPALNDHQIAVTESEGFGGPELAAAADVDILVTLDVADARALHRAAFETDALRLVLADDFPWDSLYGASLPDLLDSWVGGLEGSSALRRCAAAAVALEPLGAGAFFPLSYLLSSHRERFPELLWGTPYATP